MPVPSSTYRIQLHKDFTLRDLERIIDYLHTLGIDTVYASPIMQAAPGSMHGYDVTDPHVINSEIGDIEDLKSIIREVRKKDMQWLQDIVPNHMAFHTANFRLMDVLERGPDSSYYRYFDINWEHHDEDLKGRVMVPFLGDPIDDCLAQSQLKLALAADGLKVSYFETIYPLSVSAYPLITDALTRVGSNDAVTLLQELAAASNGTDYSAWQAAKVELSKRLDEVPELARAINAVLKQINQNKDQLSDVLDHQYYRLCYWKETDRRINYRRFFTVNELICLRMEDEEVFGEYHKVLFKLFREKLVDGFRIDHIDGLLDPGGYTRALRSHTSDSAYLIAEKILEAKEDMPAQWPLQGTSGYEFLSFLNQLLTYRAGARQLLDFYRELVPALPEYRRLIFNSKRLILENYMSGEWDNLARLFRDLGFSDNWPDARMRSALGLFMLCLPVYRIYPDTLPLKGRSLAIIHETFDRAVRTDGEYSEDLDYLRTLFTNPPGENEDRILAFLRRLMQFTGPLTAKGVEDTTFYIYNPLISHDEVGDSPGPLGMTVRRFHDRMQARQSATPLSLNATATHDTKRGEDARVRINVLSRIPTLWKEHVRQWLDMNAPFRVEKEGRTVPEINDEYFIYQSMLGGFPENFQVTGEWKNRVKAYLKKALREAKVNTNWSEPDEAYEQSCETFIDKILGEDHPFLTSFVPFVKLVCEHAMVYSLTQVLIKLTAPGIPDIYQGCELWDLSFVDPDNRRPVDYDRRMQFLFQLIIKEAQGMEAVFAYLQENRAAGIEKLYVIRKVLDFRKSHPTLFTGGAYVPVEITGDSVNAAAYARTDGGDWALTIFPFGLVKHGDDGVRTDGQYVVLPEAAPARWHNLFTGEVFEAPNQLSLNDVFGNFPVAFLTATKSR